jgi:hypothetical protein
MNLCRFFRIGQGFFLFLCVTQLGQAQAVQGWKPSTDWGHWRLGQKADLEFLQKNHMTITFGQGAPNFEQGSRKDFDAKMEKAKADNRALHEKGYVVLRYMSSSINGRSESNQDTPKREQIELLKFYRNSWNEYSDYIGPKPAEDPTTWLMVRADGTFPFYRYAPYGKQPDSGFEAWGCPNNPDYVRMMEGRIRATAESGIDGTYIDWTQIAGETCYCQYCRRNFLAYLEKHLPIEIGKAKYGAANYADLELPRKRGEKFWMEWINFRGYTVAEYHKHLRGIARKYNPNFMISGNVFGGFGYGPIAYDAAGNIEMLGREGYEDFIYSEMQEFLDSAPRKNEAGVKITNSPALKFLAAATHGKPTIVYATEITPPIFPNPNEKCLSAMAQINIVEAHANHAIFREKRETPPGATQVYDFLSRNESKLLTCQLQSNIAIVSSLQHYLADELSFAFSTSRVFADRGISHVMIVEDDLLGENLSRYELVILPYLPLLSAEKQRALLRYVEQGGKLLILGECGIKDQFNLPQHPVPLAVSLGKGEYPRQEVSKKIRKGEVHYNPLVIPANRFLIPMKTKGEYTTFGPTMADLFADIPEGYTRNRIDPVLRATLEKVVDQSLTMVRNQVTRLAGQAPFVEVTAMLSRDQNRMLVHLVNYDVTLDGTITPAKNLKVEAALPAGKKAKTVQVCGDLTALKNVNFQPLGDKKVSFDVDQVSIYGLAVIELE